MKSSAGLAGRGLTGAALPAGECGGCAETGLGAVRKGTGSVGKAGQGRGAPSTTLALHVHACLCSCVVVCTCMSLSSHVLTHVFGIVCIYAG